MPSSWSYTLTNVGLQHMLLLRHHFAQYPAMYNRIDQRKVAQFVYASVFVGGFSCFRCFWGRSVYFWTTSTCCHCSEVHFHFKKFIKKLIFTFLNLVCIIVLLFRYFWNLFIVSDTGAFYVLKWAFLSSLRCEGPLNVPCACIPIDREGCIK